MNKTKEKLIKKLIGDTPIIMNVTVIVDEPIKGASPDGIFDKCNIGYSKRFLKEQEKQTNKTAVIK